MTDSNTVERIPNAAVGIVDNKLVIGYEGDDRVIVVGDVDELRSRLDDSFAAKLFE